MHLNTLLTILIVQPLVGEQNTSKDHIASLKIDTPLCNAGGTLRFNAHLCTILRFSVKKTAIQQTLTHYKASTMSTNIQNSFNFSCMHKRPLIPFILVKWIQITYIIAFNSHNSLQYSKVLL